MPDTKSVTHFFNLISTTPALQEKLEEAFDQESLEKLILQLGEDNGYTLSNQEVHQIAVQFNKLTDEQLETVAAGSRPDPGTTHLW
jgi:hypothetical protein